VIKINCIRIILVTNQVIGRVGVALTLLSRIREVFSSGWAPIILTKVLCSFLVSPGKIRDIASIRPEVLQNPFQFMYSYYPIMRFHVV
jgi:hypothetical protein